AGVSDITLSLPRVIELFEAHKPKRPATLAGVAGVVRLADDALFIQPNQGAETRYPVTPGRRPVVEDGQRVAVGQMLTEGPADPRELLRLAGVEAVRAYLLEEIQRVYAGEGVEIDDKHVEVVIARMLARVKVTDGGDTELLPGQLVEAAALRSAAAR